MFDGEAFGAEIVQAVRAYVDRTHAPLVAEARALREQVAGLTDELAMLQARPDTAEVAAMIAKAIADHQPVLQSAFDPDEARAVIEDVRRASEQVREAAAALPTAGGVARLIAAEIATQLPEAVAALPAPHDGEPGKDADPEAVRALVDEAVAALPPARDGRDADPEDIQRMVADAVAALPEPAPPEAPDPDAIKALVATAIAEIPKPQDGKSLTLEDVAPLIHEEVQFAVIEAIAAMPEPAKAPDPEAIKALVAAAISEIPLPKDGTSVTIEDAAPMIEDRVQRAVADAIAALPEPERLDPDAIDLMVVQAIAALPPPKDGASVTVEDVTPLIEAQVAKLVAALPPPKDPVGLAGAVIDREGALVLTLTDGATKDLGRVEGRDGKDGAPGKDGERGERGFSLEDFDTQLMEDGRTVLLKFVRGEMSEAHEICFPNLVDRGVYKAGANYVRGDGVTWAGSFWIAQRDTAAKPELSDDWRLAVKRGRDGKDGQPGGKGEPGKKGDPGRDGRTLI